MQPTGQVPEAFVAYVTRYAGGLATACQDLTGNPPLAEALLRDLLSTVALRWWWLRRRRATAAIGYLDRLIAREARAWPATTLTGRPERGPKRVADLAERGLGTDAAPATRMAHDVWRRAQRLRARRRLVLVAALAGVGCAVAVGPRAPHAVEPDPFPGPEPTAIPAGVLVLPTFTDLAKLQSRHTALPERIDVNAASARSLASAPVSRAVAVARPELGALVVVANDGTTRRVDDAALAGARLLSTSLSPDGERIAMIASDGLLVIEVDTGRVRSLGGSSVRPGTRALAWRSPRTVLVPVSGGSREVNVDTGAVTALAHISGLEVVSGRGSGADQLTELTAASFGLPARIRVWRAGALSPSPGATPGTDTGDTSGESPPPAPPSTDVEDRPIVGPPWVGAWVGAGWSAQDTFVRGCSTNALILPSSVGTARAAIAAVGADGGHMGTLTTVDFTTLEIVGFADAQTVLVSAGSAQMATAILAWNPRTQSLQRVADLNGFVRVSVADLLAVGR